MVFAHGGGFYFGGRGELEHGTFEPLVRRGFVVASIDYRTIPAPGCTGGPPAACVQGIRDASDDALSAVDFLRTNSARYRIDPTRIAIEGTSAGAIMAMNAAYSSSEDPARSVRAAIAMSGAQLVSGTMSPGDAPTLLFNAEDDATVPFEWAQSTVDRAKAEGLLSILTTWPTGGHEGYLSHLPQVIDESASFLWWQMDLQSAST